jgi:hypothetical protein
MPGHVRTYTPPPSKRVALPPSSDGGRAFREHPRLAARKGIDSSGHFSFLPVHYNIGPPFI